MIQQFSQLLGDEDGATMVEYAIMVALIAAVCLLVVSSVGSKVSSAFNSANTGWG